jgi:hypothetical protein
MRTSGGIETVHTRDTAEIWKLVRPDRFRTINEIWQIETTDVVSDNDVWIHLGYELLPAFKHLCLVLETFDLRTDNMRYVVQAENVPNEGRALSCHKC